MAELEEGDGLACWPVELAVVFDVAEVADGAEAVASVAGEVDDEETKPVVTVPLVLASAAMDVMIDS